MFLFIENKNHYSSFLFCSEEKEKEKQGNTALAGNSEKLALSEETTIFDCVDTTIGVIHSKWLSTSERGVDEIFDCLMNRVF